MLLKQRETEHLPTSRVPQAVCTGWYIIPVRTMRVLNIREVYKIFLRYQRSHIFLRGCKREVEYVHKIAEMLGRFMSALRWLPFSFLRHDCQRSAGIALCSDLCKGNICPRMEHGRFYGMLTCQVFVTSPKATCEVRLSSVTETSASVFWEILGNIFQKDYERWKISIQWKLFHVCEFLLLLATSELCLDWNDRMIHT